MKRKNLYYIVIAAILVILILALPHLLDAEDSASPQAEPPAVAETVGTATEQADTSYHGWANPDTLPDHFDRHGGDFSAKDQYDYARMAHELYENRDNFQVKTDKSNIRVYDPTTNSFGAFHKDGTTKTFFKPDDGQAYFDRQPGD